jgi:hypothetical protein
MIKLLNINSPGSDVTEESDPNNFSVPGTYPANYTGFVKIVRAPIGIYSEIVFESLSVNGVVDFEVVGWQCGDTGATDVYTIRNSVSNGTKAEYLKELLLRYQNDPKVYKVIAAKMLGND